MEGYPKAAAKFSKEANLQPQQEDEAIRTRQQIQKSIHTGSIEDAIEALNELDPEVGKAVRFRLFVLGFAGLEIEAMHHS
jgi:glucose-induced degradation protein 8